MASIYHLIKSVLPTQNSLSVLTTIKPRLFFVASMQKNTLTAKTILFYKVNGSVVPATYEYDKINQVLEIQPTVPLDGNTQYQVRILSGEQGPRTTLKETSSPQPELICGIKIKLRNKSAQCLKNISMLKKFM